MSKVSYDGNSNPIGVNPMTNTIVSSAKLRISARKAHKVLLIREFSAEGNGTGLYIVGDIQVNGNTFLNTQVNNLNGTFGTIVTVTGVVDASPGDHTFDLRCYTNASVLSVHHRALSVVDLE